jgi:hypothetical protein
MAKSRVFVVPHEVSCQPPLREPFCDLLSDHKRKSYAFMPTPVHLAHVVPVVDNGLVLLVPMLRAWRLRHRN